MTVLVTGGTGQIGQSVVRKLHGEGRDVIAYDFHVPESPPVPDDIQVVRGDVSDWTDVLNVVADNDVSGVVHLANANPSYTNVRPYVGVRTNIEGTLNVLEAARILDLEKVVVFSSASVHGIHDDIDEPMAEGDMVFPPSGFYPATKIANEGFCNNYRDIHGIDVTVLRPSRVYGPNRPDRKLLPIDILVRNAVAGEDLVYESGSDTPIDYTYIDDMVRATITAYDTEWTDSLIYNVSSGELRAVGEIVEILREEFPDQRIEVGDGLWEGILERPELRGTSYQRGLRPALDITRAREELGYEPEFLLEDGVRSYIRSLGE